MDRKKWAWKKWAWCSLFAGAGVTLGACGDDGGGNMPPETHRYVVSEISIPEVMGMMAAGFNLDGMVSTGMGSTCVDMHADYRSITDPMEDGVDNGLAELVPALGSLLSSQCPTGTPAGDCLKMLLDRQILDGRLLIVMEVRDINSFNNDPMISAQFYLGTVPTCNPGCRWDMMANSCRNAGTFGSMASSMCSGATMQEACTAMMGDAMSCRPMVSGSRLAPGQTFDVQPVGPVINGSITNGRLRLVSPMLTISLDTSLGTFDLVLRNAELRANITREGLTNGAIGGALRVQDIVDTANRIMMGSGATVESVLSTAADLDPDPMDMTRCRSISAGLLFSATSAAGPSS
jgi:hypothetical protein